MHKSFILLNWYNNLYMQFIYKQNKRKKIDSRSGALMEHGHWSRVLKPRQSSERKGKKMQVTSRMSREHDPG